MLQIEDDFIGLLAVEQTAPNVRCSLVEFVQFLVDFAEQYRAIVEQGKSDAAGGFEYRGHVNAGCKRRNRSTFLGKRLLQLVIPLFAARDHFNAKIYTRYLNRRALTFYIK